jgi:hypothetical protein
MRWGIVLSLICLGCGAASSATNQPNAKIAPRLLYPMTKGNAWSYDVDSGDNEKMLTVHRVISVEGDQVQILTGKDVQHFRVSDEGILRVSNSVWLLKAPIEVDAEWPSSSGMTARVTSINAKVNTPEGEFNNCVEIQESGGETQRHITTIYCVGVGPVYVESKITLQDREVGIVGRLRGHEVQ